MPAYANIPAFQIITVMRVAMVRQFTILVAVFLASCALNTQTLSGDILIPEESADRVFQGFNQGADISSDSDNLTVGESYALKSVYLV